jgi:prophage regulatory protein
MEIEKRKGTDNTPVDNYPLKVYFMRKPAVIAATGLSGTTIYEHMGKNLFPASVSIGGNRVAWLSTEIEAWQQAKINDRNNKKSA